MSLDVVEETLLILQENQCDFLLELDVPVSRWMFSALDLLQQILFVHLRLEQWILHFLSNITFFVLSLFEYISEASIVSNSSRSATSTSPFQISPGVQSVHPRNNPGKTFFPNWWILDWSFADSTNEPNGMIGLLTGSPKRLSNGVFSHQTRDLECFAEHSMDPAHQCSSRPDCNSTADVPPFTLRTALSAIPFVSDLCGVDVLWLQERSSQAFPNSKELSVLMTIWLPFRLQELLQAPFGFLRSFLFCKDTTGSIGWPSPAPRLHIDDCFEIHNLHRELCDRL